MKQKRTVWAVVGAAVILCGLSIWGSVRPVTIVLEPLQSSVSAVADWLDTTFFSGRWEKQWQQSREELLQLRAQVAETEELRQENEFLRHFLQLKETRRDMQIVMARVIAKDSADVYHGFCINVGELDGVKTGDVVLSQDGLAGTVAQVGINWATVRTLYHPSVAVGARVSRANEDGITAADTELRVITLPRNSIAVEGDLVVTSGLGGLYPAGLPIGRLGIPTPHPDGVSAYASLTLFFDPAETRQVLVITDFADRIRHTEE